MIPTMFVCMRGFVMEFPGNGSEGLINGISAHHVPSISGQLGLSEPCHECRLQGLRRNLSILDNF